MTTLDSETLDIEIPVSRAVRKYMSSLGKKGGPATLAKYGREHFVNMRKLSGTKKKATAELEIPEV